MGLDDLPHIIQAEAKALHLMQVARRDPIEFLKDLLLLIRSDPDAVVQNTNYQLIAFITGTDLNERFAVLILKGIIQEVLDDVAKMDRVHLHPVVGGLELHFQAAAIGLYLCMKRADHFSDQVV